MVLIRESSDFAGKQVKVNTIQSSETGKLIIIEENGILLLRDDGIHVYYNSHNIISIEYIPPMGITTTQQKKMQIKEEEKDDIFKNIDKERVKLLIRSDKIKEIINDSDYEIEINIDKIEIDDGNTAEIVGDKIIVYDEDFIQIAKEISNDLNLKIERSYEE